VALLVGFLIPLPSALAFPEDAVFCGSEEPGKIAAVGRHVGFWEFPPGYSTSVRFVQVPAPRQYAGMEWPVLHDLQATLAGTEGHTDEPERDQNGVQTVAVAVTRVEESDSDLSPAFDRAFAWTRQMCAAWRCSTQYDVLLPEYDSMPMLCAHVIHDTETVVFQPGLLVLHHDPPAALTVPRQPEDFEAKLELMLLAMKTGHPMAVYQDRVREARCCLFLLGQRDNSIVLANVAVETLVDNVLTALAWEKGMDPGKAAKCYYKGQGLRQRIRIHLADLIGGDWDPAGSGPVAVWDKRLAKLRHRVVHEGYLPSREEAVSAVDALSVLEAHIISRVADRTRDYPKTALLIAARKGIEAQGMYTDKFKHWLEENLTQDSFESLLTWRQDMYELLG
jgi:hypothetical protein